MAPPRRALPLPRLGPGRSAGETIYRLTAVGPNGRVGDRGLPARLGWSPGTRLDIQEEHGLIVVAAAAHGVFRVAGQGFLFLPAPARHWCGLVPGDRVLLVADPAAGWLVVHPPAAVDAMVAAAHEAVWGGESE